VSVQNEYALVVETVDLDRLKPWSRNPRVGHAVDGIERSISSFGYINPIIVQKGTYRILAGHGRLKALKQGGARKVPVVVVDMTDDQANKYTVADNRLGDLSQWDLEVLAPIIHELSQQGASLADTGFESARVDDILRLSVADADLDHAAHMTAKLEEGIYSYNEGATFPSSNKWGIPDLREDMLCKEWPERIYTGEEAVDVSKTLYIWKERDYSRKPPGGFLGFYQDDYKFESLWENAVKGLDAMKKGKWQGVMSPDFSVWRDDPVIVQMWAIYKSRWCARFWQEAGIKIIPSINWSGLESHGCNYLGIPKGIPVASIQCRTTGGVHGKPIFGRALALAVDEIGPKVLILYGGAENFRWLSPMLPKGPEYVFIECMTGRRVRNYTHRKASVKRGAL
jgi:ParB/RepB/Spo0J family partition protein